MKCLRWTLLSIAMMVSISIMAQEEKTVTTKVKTVKNGVTTITTTTVTTKDGKTIKEEDTRHTYENGYPLSKTARKDANRTSYLCSANTMGFGIGFINTLDAPSNMKTTMGKSIELDWNFWNLGYTFCKNNTISVGLGLMWRNFRMTHENYFAMDNNGVVSVSTYPDDANSKSSRIHTVAFTVPVLYRHKWNNGVQLYAGTEFAFNRIVTKWNNIKTRYTLNDVETTTLIRRVHARPINVNYVASVAYKNTGLYVRYAPNDVLEKGYGPSFNSISFGFRFMSK